MSNTLLDVQNLTMKFGGLIAIDDLSFAAKKDHITSIIGPNGAGKTTVFNCLTGFYKATAGSMFLNKENKKMDLKKFSDIINTTNKNTKTNKSVEIASTKPGQIFIKPIFFFLIRLCHLFIKEIVFART